MSFSINLDALMGLADQAKNAKSDRSELNFWKIEEGENPFVVCPPFDESNTPAVVSWSGFFNRKPFPSPGPDEGCPVSFVCDMLVKAINNGKIPSVTDPTSSIKTINGFRPKQRFAFNVIPLSGKNAYDVCIYEASPTISDYIFSQLVKYQSRLVEPGQASIFVITKSKVGPKPTDVRYGVTVTLDSFDEEWASKDKNSSLKTKEDVLSLYNELPNLAKFYRARWKKEAYDSAIEVANGILQSFGVNALPADKFPPFHARPEATTSVVTPAAAPVGISIDDDDVKKK